MIVGTALTNLRRRSLRSACMIFFAFMLSGCLFCCTVLADSLKGTLDNTIGRLGADIIVVPEEYEREMADSLFLGELCSFTFDRKWVSEIGKIEGIAECTPQLYMASLAADCCSAATQMIVFDPETDFIVTPWLMEEGFKLPGDGELYIGSLINPPEPDSIKFFGEDYRITGRLEKTGTSYDTCVFMTAGTAEQIRQSQGWEDAFGKPEKPASELVSSLMIRVEEGADAKAIARQINFSIDGAPVKAYTTNAILSGAIDSVESMSGYTSVLIWLMVILVTAALASVFTITMNERTKEFGILSCLGVSSEKLSGIVLTEGAVIGLTGGLLGAGLAFACIMIFEVPLKLALELPRISTSLSFLLSLGLKCLGLSLGVSLLSSLYSAFKVGRADLDGLIKGEEL